jgi:hypothetical protein
MSKGVAGFGLESGRVGGRVWRRKEGAEVGTGAISNLLALAAYLTFSVLLVIIYILPNVHIYTSTLPTA